jgi:hypothetical protein
MKDAVATMGAVLPDDAGGRDAVHVAVISAIAYHSMEPGAHVSFIDVPTATTEGKAGVSPLGDEPIGIADPFIKDRIKEGERFWLYLYPRTITGLRHQWTHPAFADDQGTVYGTPSQKLAAEEWIKNFVHRSDCPGYEELMAGVARIADEGGSDYFYVYESNTHGEIPDEFWVMAEIVLGRPIKGKRPSYFSCSC